MPLSPENNQSNQEEEVLPSIDDTESDAKGVMASLQMMIAVAEQFGLVEADVQRLKVLSKEVLILLVKYQVLRTNAQELYKKYNKKKNRLIQDLHLDDETKNGIKLTKKQKKRISNVIGLKLQAHEDAISSLAPGAVIASIKKNEEFITEERIRITELELSSYLRVELTHAKHELKVTATTEKVADQIVQRLKENENTNILVVNAPPGSGKTTFMDNIETKFRIQGWGVVQINFDDVIGKFFEREGKETRTWSNLTAEEFDKSFFDLEKMVAKYYPKTYENKRIIVMIDTLGYNIDQMFYGLWLIGRLLKNAVNEGNALVLSIIPQPAVVEHAKKLRENADIDLSNAKNAALLLKKSKGAPSKAIARHDEELGKKVTKASTEPAFLRLRKNTDMSVLSNYVPAEELVKMAERLAYTILTKNEHEINNWWFIINLLRQKEDEALNLE